MRLLRTLGRICLAVAVVASRRRRPDLPQVIAERIRNEGRRTDPVDRHAADAIAVVDDGRYAELADADDWAMWEAEVRHLYRLASRLGSGG